MCYRCIILNDENDFSLYIAITLQLVVITSTAQIVTINNTNINPKIMISKTSKIVINTTRPEATHSYRTTDHATNLSVTTSSKEINSTTAITHTFRDGSTGFVNEPSTTLFNVEVTDTQNTAVLVVTTSISTVVIQSTGVPSKTSSISLSEIGIIICTTLGTFVLIAALVIYFVVVKRKKRIYHINQAPKTGS